MVISHKYKYVFIEFPLTGSTSVSNALVENYSGKRILYKHASYFDFKKIATEKEKQYFIFSCIRNPLDQAVSHYYKYKNDHRAQYSDLIKSKGFRRYIFWYQIMRFKYIANSASFDEYFLKFYKWPYNSWSTISHSYCDYVMKFENLDSSYFKALKRIGIEDPLPLPKKNKTSKVSEDFLSCYTLKSIIRAKKVYGIYMDLIGYDFPKEWGEVKITTADRIKFKLQNIYKHAYWKYFRYYILNQERKYILQARNKQN